MAELEKLEYPKPLRELRLRDVQRVRARAPLGAAATNVRPKSIAREMFERFMDFTEYVREYELERAEGMLLRYLSRRLQGARADGARAGEDARGRRDRGVPAARWSAPVDSSLLDEWERMRDEPGRRLRRRRWQPPPEDAPRARSTSPATSAAFTVLVRNAMFQLLRALGAEGLGRGRRLADPGGRVERPRTSSARSRRSSRSTPSVRLDPRGTRPGPNHRHRGATQRGRWDVVQLFSAPAAAARSRKPMTTEEEDETGEASETWAVSCRVDLAASAAAARPASKFSVRRVRWAA